MAVDIQREILVVGGCGLVGHLVAPFLERHGGHWWRRLEPQTCADKCPWACKATGDATNIGDVFSGLRANDAVVYMAKGQLGNTRSLFEAGVLGLYNVLLVAKELRTRRVVLVSSVSVCDDWQELLRCGEDTPPSCSWDYGVVKVMAEQMAEHFARTCDMSVIALRFANPMRDEDRAAQNTDCPYATSGSQMARAIEAAVALLEHRGFDAVNICGDADPAVVNLEKAKRLLGWEP